MSKITSDIGCLNCCHKNESSNSCTCKCHELTTLTATNQIDKQEFQKIDSNGQVKSRLLEQISDY